jgi:CHASE3 domain sensor protein
VTAEAQRRRAVWQILLLSAGLLVLVAISVTSVLLVNKARDASGLVVHTVEVESQLSSLLLEIRRAESATRAYLLSSAPQFLAEYENAAANILPAADQLAKITSDNPVQVKNNAKLRAAIEQRLTEFARGIDRIKNNDVATSVKVLREGTSTGAVRAIAEAGRDMRAEEDRLFAMRTRDADRAQVLASSVTIAGSSLVIALAGFSIFLVRRS